MKIMYEEIPAFEKDFKRLSKQFRSLPEDFELAKKATIELYHLKKINNRSVFPIPRFCFEEVKIYKLKKFTCRSLKGRGNKSGIRVIYAFFPKILKVVFIQIYFKGDEVIEDKKRIKEYLKSLDLKL